MSCKRQCVDPSERVISGRNVRDSTQGRSPESAASWVVVLHPMRNSAMLANSGDAHGWTTSSPAASGCAEAFTHPKAPAKLCLDAAWVYVMVLLHSAGR